MSKQYYIDQLFNSMSQLKKLLETRTQDSHEEKTATIMQYSALILLKERKNLTVGDIASRLRLSKSSATQLIERLVKAGLVDRIIDQDDRRIVRLCITSAGEQHLIELKRKITNKIGKVLSKIPEQDLKELVRIHNELIETLRIEQNA